MKKRHTKRRQIHKKKLKHLKKIKIGKGDFLKTMGDVASVAAKFAPLIMSAL